MLDSIDVLSNLMASQCIPLSFEIHLQESIASDSRDSLKQDSESQYAHEGRWDPMQDLTIFCNLAALMG